MSDQVYLIVRNSDGVVVGAATGLPDLPEHCDAVERAGVAADAWIGWRRVDGAYVDPTLALVDQPPPVPTSVTRYQLVRAMRQSGLKTTFDAALAANEEAAEDWSLCTSVTRTFPLVLAFAAGTGTSDAAVDDLFRLAATFP